MLRLDDLLLRFHGAVEAPVDAAAASLASDTSDEDLAQAATALSEQVHDFTSAGLLAATALHTARAEVLPAALRNLRAQSGPLTQEQVLCELGYLKALLQNLSDASWHALESHADLHDRIAYLTVCTEVVADTRAIDGECGDRLTPLASALAQYREAEAVLRGEGELLSKALYGTWRELEKMADLVDGMSKLCGTVDSAAFAFPFFECLGTTLHACLMGLTSNTPR